MNQVIQGDCLSVLQTLADCFVDSIVTDPPAGIAFMNKTWDKDKGGKAQWIEWMTDVARECLRVIKPGGHALVWAIPRTSHWTGTAWENAGWEPRDKIYHCFGSGFPKSHNLDGDWQGWGSALKPAIEEWWLFRRPLQGTIAQNVQEWGTGALNIDGCRVGYQSQSDVDRARGRKGDYEKMGQKSGNSFTVEFATPVFKSEVDPAGRWPANVILSYNKDEYKLRETVTPQQLRRLSEWLCENT